MRDAVAQVKNVTRCADVLRAVHNRGPGVPGICVLHSPSGYGKTTTIARLAIMYGAIYLRALATWSPSSMLASIMRELDANPLGRSADMVHYIVAELAKRRVPLFIDEADHVVGKKMLVETLRDLHDLSDQPLVLIGMHEFRRKLMHREQIARRVSHWVRFDPATLADAKLLAETICEVGIAPDLLYELHRASEGSIGRLKVGIQHIESHAKRKGLKTVGLGEWGKREFNFVQLPLDLGDDDGRHS